MSTVAPNGQVRLLANVPLDSRYEDTLYFANELAQRTYFLSLTPVHTMSNATRVRDGVIAVDVGEDTIINCNYLMFQNQNFSSKWFYAFIVDRQFINNGTTHITYVIDDIQTYLMSGSMTLLECLIDRQHTTTDAINDNLIPEDIGAPEMTNIENINSYSYGGSMSAVLFTDVHTDQTPEQTLVTNGFSCVNGLITQIVPISAANYIVSGVIQPSGWVNMEALVEKIISENKSESIVGGVCVPQYFLPSGGLTSNSMAHHEEKMENKSVMYTSIDGYTPKNNKLFTSPYECIRIQTADGQCVFLEPQWIGGDTISWIEMFELSMTPELLLVPTSYKGQAKAYAEAISFDKFPQFGVAVDGYKAWVASGGLATRELSLQQTKESSRLEMVGNAYNAGSSAMGGALQLAGGIATGNAALGAGGGLGMADSVANGVINQAKIQQTIKFANENFDLQHAIAKTFPPSMKGGTRGDCLAATLNIGYTVDKLTINAQQAKAIDDYFTMFGYKVNQVAVPNIHARPHYTYVKTVGCKVNGGAPTESIVNIENIFDNGVRFWVNASEVGKYNEVDNRPSSPSPTPTSANLNLSRTNVSYQNS